MGFTLTPRQKLLSLAPSMLSLATQYFALSTTALRPLRCERP